MDDTKEAKKPLSFSEFLCVGYSYVEKRRHTLLITAVIGFPLIVLFLFAIFQGRMPRDGEEWGSCLALPIGLPIMTYFALFNRDNHPAKGNEETFGCLLMIVLAPVMLLVYGIYRLSLVVQANESVKGVSVSVATSTAVEEKVKPLEERIKRLNDLLKKGLISKLDYDEQLSRLVSQGL